MKCVKLPLPEGIAVVWSAITAQLLFQVKRPWFLSVTAMWVNVVFAHNAIAPASACGLKKNANFVPTGLGAGAASPCFAIDVKLATASSHR